MHAHEDKVLKFTSILKTNFFAENPEFFFVISQTSWETRL